jgi:guanylate kinase
MILRRIKEMNERGKLIVISGPSGAGKSTVVFKAIEGRSNVCFSTSVTTRKPRPNEVDGKEYFFVDLDRFKEMVENDELLEHAEYVANSYGTPRAYVEQKLNEGLDVILDIEVQGARQVNEKMPDAVKIFIIPPSMTELRKRLENRGTDTARAIEARLMRARQEYAEADFYDYIIVNDNAEKAAEELSAIMTAERCRAAGRQSLLTDPV